MWQIETKFMGGFKCQTRGFELDSVGNDMSLNIFM